MLVIAAIFTVGLAADNAQASSASRELLRIRLTIENELRNSPEMLAAIADVADTRTQYAEQRQLALKRLERDSDYRRTRVKADELQEKLDAVYYEYRYGIPPRDVTLPLAKQIFELNSAMSEKEQDLFAQHADLDQARDAYIEAARHLIELRRKIPTTIRNDPRFRRALQRMR